MRALLRRAEPARQTTPRTKAEAAEKLNGHNASVNHRFLDSSSFDALLLQTSDELRNLRAILQRR